MSAVICTLSEQTCSSTAPKDVLQDKVCMIFMMTSTSPESTTGAELSPAVEGGVEAEEEAEAEGHEE